MASVTIPGNAMDSEFVPDPRAGVSYDEPIGALTDVPHTTNNKPEISVGSASGIHGKMQRVTYSGSWIKSDVTNDNIVPGEYVYNWKVIYRTQPGNYLTTSYFTRRAFVIIPVRTITLKTEQEYLAEMRALITPESSGVQPKIVNRQVTSVAGGHAGYSFALKAKGEVEKRYNVDFKLGDTIRVNDTRLGVVYTGVVSGAVETIDSNGYNVDIEIGTLGATLEQRVQRVI